MRRAWWLLAGDRFSSSLHRPHDLDDRDAHEYRFLEIETVLSLADLAQFQIHASKELLKFSLFQSSAAHVSIATFQAELAYARFSLPLPASAMFLDQCLLRLCQIVVP